MLISRKGFATLAGVALLIMTSNANALLFWSDQSNGKTIYNYLDPDPTNYSNSGGQQLLGEYGIGGTDYANGVRFINSGIQMDITANANTPQPIDSRYQGDTAGVKTFDARLTASSNGVIGGHGTGDDLISQSAVQALIDSGDLPGTVNAADFATSNDPYDITTSFSISFSHDVILNEVFFDRISKGGNNQGSSTFNQTPTFDITGGSNGLSLLGLNTVTVADGSTVIPGGALFLAGELYTIDIHAVASALNSIAEFQAWDVTAVPLPAAVWFMLSGLVTLFGAKRRKRQA